MEIKRDFTFYDFVNLYDELVRDRLALDCDREGLGIIYDHLEELAIEADDLMELSDIKDLIRFDIEIMSADEIIKSYDTEGQSVDYFINDNTYLIGKYIRENKKIYIFYNF